MTLYVINGEDVPDSLEKRLAVRPAHLARLETLQQEGRLILAEFDSLEAAQAWAEADPYVTSGVYASVTVKPFKKVLPI